MQEALRFPQRRIRAEAPAPFLPYTLHVTPYTARSRLPDPHPRVSKHSHPRAVFGPVIGMP
jgi:hypothetical protein